MMSAQKLREWAERCEAEAAASKFEDVRGVMLRKCEALRALAESQDWLEGRSAIIAADMTAERMTSQAAE